MPPDGNIADALASTLAAQLRPTTLRSTIGGTCRRDLKSSHRPDGISTCFALMLAGRRCVHRHWHGDLLIVHHHWQLSSICACSRWKFPIAPMGKLLMRSCFDFRLRNCERRFGQLQDVRAAETLQSSHRPDGIFTCFALVLAEWRRLHQRWHGELLIVHHHWQLSSICACSRSKVPMAPMGILLTRLPRLMLAQLRPTLWSTTVCTCHRDLENFPSPQWGYC